jgi:hypothetical protein
MVLTFNALKYDNQMKGEKKAYNRIKIYFIQL